MDSQTLESLQFAEVLQRVGQHCQSALGRERIESARPKVALEEVEAELAPVREAMNLLDKGHDLSLDGLGDPRRIWDAIGPQGHALEGPDLYQAAGFLETVRRVEGFLRDFRSDAPTMAKLGDGLSPSPGLERDLRRSVQPDGTIADHASEALARIRSEVHRADQRLRAYVDKQVSELADKGYLQDAYATLRGGRYVLPVRSTSRSRVTGIVHGASNTGETLFIEPAAVVEMSNDLEELRQAELRETTRIRLALTERLRTTLPLLRADTDRLAGIDSVWGRARAARRFHWSIPRLESSGPMRIHDAHHPLLHIQNRDGSIGVKLALDAEDRVIVVTGPNAGGKTTLLKTLGLAVLLLQSGVPAPLSPDCRIPVFSEVWAEIGDAQDITAGQSTFSAHARRLAMILRRARSHSFVLLDELGTATDPSEGAALAEACLEILRIRGGLTLATSHLTPLKQWAHETPNVRNASFALDPHSQRPTFSLMLDVPGTSEALVIAEREGVPEEVLSLARKRLDQGEVNLAALLRSLGARERGLAEAEAEARRRLETLGEQEELARRRAESLREERRRLRESAAREREEHLARLREEIETRIAALPAREAPSTVQRTELSRVRREVDALQREAEIERRRSQQALPPALSSQDLAPGREVYVIDLREMGQILSIEGSSRKATVALGRGLIVEVPVEGLARSQDEIPSPAPLQGSRSGGATMGDLDDEDGDLEAGRFPRAKHSKKIKRQQDVAASSQDSQSGRSKKPTLDWRRGGAPKSVSSVDSKTGAGGKRPGEKASEGDASGGKSYTPSPVRFDRKPSINWQIDLHGVRVAEAIEIVDKYLDDAVLADLPYVKICHGQGSGALARSLREFFSHHPHVRAWRYGLPEEGGAGVTVVDLH